MPVTPLTSTKSGQRSASFSGPFTRIEDTADIYGAGQGLFTPFVGADASPQQDPYPLIRYGTTFDHGTGDKGYSFQWLKNTTEFGVYYPDMNQFGSSQGSLSGDLANLTIIYEGATVAQDYYKTIAVDDTVYALGPDPSPLSGPVTRPIAGMFLDTVGSGFYYSFVDGLAEVFALNVTPYWENARYLIFTDGTKKNAFNIPDEFTPPDPASNGSAFFLQNHGTINDGVYNYTVQKAFEGANSIPTYLTKWQSSTYDVGGPFNSEAFSITLSDAADDTIWQDYFANGGANGKQINIIHNTNKWIFIAYAADTIVPDTINDRFAATVFIFSMDMTSYERVDVTFSDTLNWASYFMDVDGLEYAIGSDPADGVIIYQVGSAPVDVGRPLRGWTFTQDDHDFYVLRLTDQTYVYDKLTGQWCQWASPDLTYFSGSDGCDWEGFNVCCDPDSGDIHKIDPTGRLDGGTTPISTRVYGFVTTRFRKNVPMFMAEAAISEGRPPTGVDATSLGITLRTSDTLTWTDHGTIPGKAEGSMVTARWYGLGVASAPGVEFELSDTGYARRLDGFTIELGAAAEAAISNGQ